jgi:hypothetical protein
MIQTNQINILKLLPKQSFPDGVGYQSSDPEDADGTEGYTQGAYALPDGTPYSGVWHMHNNGVVTVGAASSHTDISQETVLTFIGNSQVTTPPGTVVGETVALSTISDADPTAGNPDADPPTSGTTVDDFTTNYFSNIQKQIANDPNLASFAALEKANIKLPTDILMTPEKLPEVIEANLNPQPTAAQFGTFRRYNKNGIFYKSNLSAIMKRDNKGSVILNIGNK